VIRFDAFSKRYGALTAVASLDLEIGAGEVVALLGPNGSGKTTSLKAAAGLITPSSGEVRLAGRPAGDPSARDGKCWSSTARCAAWSPPASTPS
jgi:ABC-type multidrug transport system ATPase subunit